ncbi:MAG TPA: 50S ribosomal protein L24 [Alkalibacterium sp.]|uniref:Large ribosomal subunit protein uL24 n=1 Tax=Alkalibacterium gilvum TaxID=1130080 RepID=A0A1H6UR68_9LACT|nr:50S ribosomal protein L24 [Alkalibacterium gilvum]MDN6293543.1 50S ribosomal protein L24 [Alkalibacterium sp.]SEI94196.1 large subunit ribosomal protein L24 [Alkalibacterium gilvum]HAJ70188.1 50S ribosomal protein L24 [Alkalibacterium sp.]
MFVKTGDKVKVIAGKDKGKEGTILAAMPKQSKVIVEGLNIMKKHTRPTGMGQEGGIVEKEAPIHVSNVQLIDPSSNEPTRVGYKEEDGKKVRYAKKSGEAL